MTTIDINTDTFKAVQSAGRMLVKLSAGQVNDVLMSVAEAAIERSGEILEENQKDLDRMAADDPKYDRLKLSPARIEDIAGEIRNVARMDSPLGKLLEQRVMPNGMSISKVTVPL